MDERIRFVIRLKDGESMASLCREFGISPKTGYKLVDRYEERLLRRLPQEVKVPACSTIHAILDRHGWVTRPKRSRIRAEGTPLSPGLNPNALWCTDYKGEFQLGNQKYCYPLTVTDHASRYLLLCEAMESNAEQFAFTAFERLFQERGPPQAIRSDNGVPFASPNGLFNLSKLSVWWLRLGITIERIRPGHPQQNGRHERMHLTLKKEATRPAGANLLQQHLCLRYNLLPMCPVRTGRFWWTAWDSKAALRQRFNKLAVSVPARTDYNGENSANLSRFCQGAA
jgi:transposase InsO family protein